MSSVPLLSVSRPFWAGEAVLSNPGPQLRIALPLRDSTEHVHAVRRVMSRPHLQVSEEGDLVPAEVERLFKNRRREPVHGSPEQCPVLRRDLEDLVEARASQGHNLLFVPV